MNLLHQPFYRHRKKNGTVEAVMFFFVKAKVAITIYLFVLYSLSSIHTHTQKRNFIKLWKSLRFTIQGRHNKCSNVVFVVIIVCIVCMVFILCFWISQCLQWSVSVFFFHCLQSSDSANRVEKCLMGFCCKCFSLSFDIQSFIFFVLPGAGCYLGRSRLNVLPKWNHCHK